MVTTRSQDKTLEGSELPLRSREAGSPSSPPLKRPRTPPERSRPLKRAKTKHSSSPQVTYSPRNSEIFKTPPTAAVLGRLPSSEPISSDEQPTHLVALGSDPPEQDEHADQQASPLAQDPNMEAHTISDAASEISNPDPSPNSMRQEAIQEFAPPKDSFGHHRRSGSDEPEENETFITAASSLELDMADESEATSDDDNDDPPEVLDNRSTEHETQGRRATLAKKPRHPRMSKSDPKPTNPPVVDKTSNHTDGTSQPGRPKKPEKTLGGVYSPSNTTKPYPKPSSTSLQSLRPHTSPPGATQVRPQPHVQLQSRLSDTRPSNSLSRYKQHVLERHKRTPFWAGRKVKFVGVVVDPAP